MFHKYYKAGVKPEVMIMEKYKGIPWVDKKELTDLLQNQEAVQITSVVFVSQGGFLSSGINECYKNIKRTLEEGKYNFAYSLRTTEIGKWAETIVAFYRFKEPLPV